MGNDPLGVVRGVVSSVMLYSMLLCRGCCYEDVGLGLGRLHSRQGRRLFEVRKELFGELR